MEEKRLDYYLCWRYNHLMNKFELCEKYDNDDEDDKRHWETHNYFSHSNMRYISEIINKMNKCLEELTIVHNRVKMK